jgi:predicted DNA binding CopG/RHH family protein
MIILKVGGFEWDRGNNAKCQRHGVSVGEIEELFQNEPRVAPDPEHSQEEDRLLAVGRTNAGCPLFVAFTLRSREGRLLVRPISARYMHAKEIAAMKKAKKRVPRLKTDEIADAFLAQDLSKLDFSQFQPVRFEFEKKDKQINMRLPALLLAALKAKARERGIPYTRLIREALERAVNRPAA